MAQTTQCTMYARARALIVHWVRIPVPPNKTVIRMLACRRVTGECYWSMWELLAGSRIRLRRKSNCNAFATEASANPTGAAELSWPFKVLLIQ